MLNSFPYSIVSTKPAAHPWGLIQNHLKPQMELRESSSHHKQQQIDPIFRFVILGLKLILCSRNHLVTHGCGQRPLKIFVKFPIRPKRESPVNCCNIDFIFDPVFRGFNKNLTDAQAMKIMFIN